MSGEDISTTDTLSAKQLALAASRCLSKDRLVTRSRDSAEEIQNTNHNQTSNRIEEASTRTVGNVPQILAPVGGREQFFAALNAGADAVFLGLKQFNARARAENFSIEDLKSLVPLAHRYGMEVLVTLNILIKDTELADLVKTLSDLDYVGVDAIIVQDLGVAEIARKYFPGLRLHASTQMAVHNAAGVQMAVEWGFKRVVLARELTAQEIKRIRATVPQEQIELEVFCHGSLCYSYSGLCFFSGAADSRSGNRGECAYTCREPYKVVSEPGQGFLFSMKDLDTAHKLNLMIEAGVDTLKIEGRKKDAQYVSSVVRLYRQKLNEIFKRNTLRANAPKAAFDLLNANTVDAEKSIREDLKLSFQRQTTSFFFEGRYHENVIDLNQPSHAGMLIGRIEAFSNTTMHVRLDCDLERFDGLKVVDPSKVYHALPQDGSDVRVDQVQMSKRYDNEELAFSVRDMLFKGRRIFEAKRGMIVELPIEFNQRGSAGSKVAKPKVGDLIFKTRSADLKRRVEKLTQPPVDERLRPLIPLTVSFDIARRDDGVLRIEANIYRKSELILSESVLTPSIEIRKSGSLLSDLKDVFALFGDEGYYTEEFRWNLSQPSEDQVFVPKSILKTLKRSIQSELSAKVAAKVERNYLEAMQSLQSDSRGLNTNEIFVPTFEIKIDRLDYLPKLVELMASGKLPGFQELIFEPKKSYLTSVDPKEFLVPLIEFTNAHALKLRLAIPTVIRAWDEPVLRLWLEAAKSKGVTAFEIGNVGALKLLKTWNMPTDDLSSDFMLYGMNREAINFWHREGIRNFGLEYRRRSRRGLKFTWTLANSFKY